MAKRPRSVPDRKSVHDGKSVSDRILAAATRLAAERPWGGVSLGAIAAAAKVTLAQLHEAFSSKTAIIVALMARGDARVVAGVDPSAFSEPARERLLDALMRRLDALAPDKQAVASMLRDTAVDPLSALCLAPGFLRSMAWTLEAAGIGSAGIAGRLRVQALAAIYLAGLCVWLRDDSEDQGKTLAFLDRRLRTAERLAALCPGMGHRRPAGEAETA